MATADQLSNIKGPGPLRPPTIRDPLFTSSLRIASSAPPRNDGGGGFDLASISREDLMNLAMKVL